MDLTKKVIEYIANQEIEAEQTNDETFTFQAYSRSGIVMVGINIDEKEDALYFDCMSKLDIEDDNQNSGNKVSDNSRDSKEDAKFNTEKHHKRQHKF